MIVLNDFLTSNIYRVTNFLRAISTLPPDNNNDPDGGVRMEQAGYVKLHKYLSGNLERMSRDLIGRKVMRGVTYDTHSLMSRKKILDQLSTLLAQLGRPSDAPDSELVYARNYALTNNNHYYSEFMRRNGHRDLSEISTHNFFYLGGTSKGGRPVFYLVCRNLDADRDDFEILVYYMFRVSVIHNSFKCLFLYK